MRRSRRVRCGAKRVRNNVCVHCASACRASLHREKVPAQTLGDRVAWIIVEGELLQDGVRRGPSSLLYPEALLTDARLPDKDGLAVTQTELRTVAIRSDDFRELCDDDPELGEILLASLALEVSTGRRPARKTGRLEAGDMGRATTLEIETIKDGPGGPKQPRASTVPPTAARARASTEPGATLTKRAPAASSFTRARDRRDRPGPPDRTDARTKLVEPRSRAR